MTDKNIRKKGFTLVELVVIMVIIAVLASVAVVSLAGYVTNSRKKMVRNECGVAVVAAQSLYTEAEMFSSRAPTKQEINDFSALDGTVIMIRADEDGEIVHLAYQNLNLTCIYCRDYGGACGEHSEAYTFVEGDDIPEPDPPDTNPPESTETDPPETDPPVLTFEEDPVAFLEARGVPSSTWDEIVEDYNYEWAKTLEPGIYTDGERSYIVTDSITVLGVLMYGEMPDFTVLRPLSTFSLNADTVYLTTEDKSKLGRGTLYEKDGEVYVYMQAYNRFWYSFDVNDREFWRKLS